MEKPLDSRSLLFLFLLSAIWGITFPAVKVALKGFPPILMGGCRFVIAAGVLAVFGWARNEPLVEQRGAGRLMLVLYALTLALQMVLLLVGIQYTSANRTTILFNTAPFWVLPLAVFFLPDEELTANKWIGTALAFVGVAALVVGRRTSEGPTSLYGDLLVLAAASLWGVRIVLLKFFPSSVRTVTIQIWQFVIAGVALLALGLLTENPADIRLTRPVVTAFLYLALMSNAVGFFLWTHLVQKEVATRVSPFLFLTPVFGVLAAGVIVDEAVTPFVALSLSLVGSGIYIVNRRSAREKAGQEGGRGRGATPFSEPAI